MTTPVLPRKRNIPPLPAHPELPIAECKQEIQQLLDRNQVLIVTGSAGCGKSTQLPLMCLEAGRGQWGKIAVTQPRRIAAISLARRVAADLGSVEGNIIGYRTRFHQKESKDSAVVFMTDGILLAEVQNDRQLRKYDTIIIDEAHERNLNIDILLGFMRKLVQWRPELKVIISSATIDTDLFSKAFNDAPVIAIPGRLFPVHIDYAPPDRAESEEAESIDYVDAAVRATQFLVDSSTEGDALVFMPTERDILEAKKKLSAHGDLSVLPLYSRLPSEQQDAIFAPSPRRKVVIATNIAETSITVPGIRFVVDTGLARVKRFMPQSGVTRLPVEPISQASANQRAGRCGRTGEGTCIRLYSDQEFQSWSEYTPPEIKRSNLAGVVLLMASIGMDRVEEFPFLEPPTDRGINGARRFLHDLGALNNNGKITRLGSEMARLPLDPHLARMVLASKTESALREVTIIATGLSTTDPREFPAQKREEATLKQQPFVNKGSDFISFVQLWDTYHGTLERLKTQNQMRKFCREHFLSYPRMREWSDIHAQTVATLSRMKVHGLELPPASADAIHRSILAGLPMNVAIRDEERKAYRSTRTRDVVIFPGSALAKKGPPWIMYHECFETSRVFARTVAAIDPAWLEELFPTLCKRAHADPHFDPRSGSVKALEAVTYLGLPIVKGRRVDFARIDRPTATEIFARDGLAVFALEPLPAFLRHNREVLDQAGRIEAKLRLRTLVVEEEALTGFYRSKIESCASIHELNRLVRKHGSDQFLRMGLSEVLTDAPPPEANLFPDTLTVGGLTFPVEYVYDPSREDDGASLLIPLAAAPDLSPETLIRAIPGLVKRRTSWVLKNLPREYRNQFDTIPHAADILTENVVQGSGTYSKSLSVALNDLYNISLSAEVLNRDVPAYLRLHLCADPESSITIGPWETRFNSWGAKGRTRWDFDDLPERVELSFGEKSLPLIGYPALKATQVGCDVVLCESLSRARKTHAAGVRALAEVVLSDDYAWLEKESKPTPRLKLTCTPFVPADALIRRLLRAVHLECLGTTSQIRTKAQFDALISSASSCLRLAAQSGVALLEEITTLLSDCLREIKNCRAHPDLLGDLKTDAARYQAMLLDDNPPDYPTLQNLPRYLKTLRIRIDKSTREPAKYRDSLNRLAPYATSIQGLDGPCQSMAGELGIMIEEFKISLFAQQVIKTRFPISEKRLDEKLATIQNCPRR